MTYKWDTHKIPEPWTTEDYYKTVSKRIGCAFVTTEKHLLPEYNDGHRALAHLYRLAHDGNDGAMEFALGLEAILKAYSKTVPIETLQELLNEGRWPND